MTKNMVDFVAIDVHENLNPLAVFAVVLFTHFSISVLVYLLMMRMPTLELVRFAVVFATAFFVGFVSVLGTVRF